MLKFRCQHCGQRIAVPARHLGKLVTCAECGQATHPLAEQLVKAKQPAAPAAPPAPPPVATTPCANCGKPLGQLQASQTWESRRVCPPCYHVLSAELPGEGVVRAAPAVVMRVAAPAAPTPPPQPALPLRERLTRSVVIFVVAVVALYGALTLLRDIAGLIATAAVAVLALLALYGVFRSRLSAKSRPESGALTAP